uniref:Dioxygenase FrzG n=1 Tax=Cladobotryum sp. TaxID=2040732 RepID=FRZG_CLASX|nr:FrzG [Cladobotryum sp.]
MERIPASAGPEAIFEAFRRDGIIVIEGFLTPDQVQRFSSEVQPGLDELTVGAPEHDEAAQTATVMDEMIGEKTKRLGQLVTRSAVFRHELLEHELMHALLEKVFVEGPMDGYWMNASEVIEIAPGSNAQPIHRDQELYDVWNRAGPAMPEAICNFISALTPFTALNGATQVAPGTHRDFTSDHLLDRDFQGRSDLKTIPAVMNPGDCIFFSGKILHGGGANHTADELRRGLAMSFIRRILTPEEAHPLSVSREIVDTMTYRGQAMLGFRSQWPVIEGVPNFYWTHQGSEIGSHIGLKEKTSGSVVL